jgi:hypothetical protein
MRVKAVILVGVVAAVSLVAFRLSMARRPSSPASEASAPPAAEPAPVATAPDPVAADPGPPPAAAPRAPVVTRKADARSNEGELLDAMRAEMAANPAHALRLAREADRRFGESPHADERGRIAIESLVRLNEIAQARDEAEPFVRKYRGTEQARYVENLTGVHPRPSRPAGARPGPNGGLPQ